jgi:hypothetical protein
MFALSVVRGKINETHRLKARNTMEIWFRGVNDMQLFAIEKEKNR